MKKKNYMTWETYFMSIALLSSFRSKDKYTQNGACIVGKDNKIIGIGYNGLPKGLSDDNSKYWTDDDTSLEKSRHSYVIHAEKNAILNSISRDLEGTRIFVTQFPCNHCAQMIIQVGISEVIYLRKKEKNEEWVKKNKVVETMFGEVGIEVISYYDINPKDTEFIEELAEEYEETYGLD